MGEAGSRWCCGKRCRLECERIGGGERKEAGWELLLGSGCLSLMDVVLGWLM